MSKKLGQESAFPFEQEEEIRLYNGDRKDIKLYDKGMSKRFYAACAAMQGMLANPDINRFGTHNGDGFDVIQQSYKFADELLKYENYD